MSVKGRCVPTFLMERIVFYPYGADRFFAKVFAKNKKRKPKPSFSCGVCQTGSFYQFSTLEEKQNGKSDVAPGDSLALLE